MNILVIKPGRKGRCACLSVFFILSLIAGAQENIITGGIQYKPLFSHSYFNTGPQSTTDSANVFFMLKPRGGYCFGMVIRKGIDNTFSLETGINYVRRNYQLTIEDHLTTLTIMRTFKLIGYEFPFQLLVFIQLGKNLFMNTAGGLSLDIFPSDWKTYDTYHSQLILRKNWALFSLTTNVGYEYRTKKNGYFYLGLSFHRPFSPIAFDNVYYDAGNNRKSRFKANIIGNYLTLDFRYFLKSESQKKKKQP